MFRSIDSLFTSLLLVAIGSTLVTCAPLYGEIEVDFDLTKQSIVRANQILASINRDVDLCLTNDVACSLKNYDDSDYQTFDGSSSVAAGYSNGNLDSPNNETEANVNVTLSPVTSSDSTVSPLAASLYGPVSPMKIVVPPASDQKFVHVLDDIDSLEVHVQSAITNFTSTRRYTYTAMLKPMLKHIHQLRNNLSLLHSRLIGVAALTNIASQVNELTGHISEALVGNDVPLDETPTSSSAAPSSSTSTSTSAPSSSQSTIQPASSSSSPVTLSPTTTAPVVEVTTLTSIDLNESNSSDEANTLTTTSASL